MPTTEVQLSYVALNDMHANPRNPKLHANDTINASINRFGMIEPIVIDKRTGYTISGHGRIDTLREQRDLGAELPDGILINDDGDWLVPAVTSWSSVNDLEAEAALVALNRTSEIGGWESQSLADILSSLQAADALDGVGYDGADLSLLLHQLDAETKFNTDQQGAIDEWLGIAGTGDQNYIVGAWRKVAVVFANEEDCRSFYERLGMPYDATERSFGWPKSLPQQKVEPFDD